jgi:hypothetical protein
MIVVLAVMGFALYLYWQHYKATHGAIGTILDVLGLK